MRFYRDLIDAYRAHPKGEPFDLVPWQERLAPIQQGRDADRTRMTLTLLADARAPVGARAAPG